MPQSKQRETAIVNLVLIILSVASLAVAAWTLVTNWMKGGTDDLFLILISLLFALLFAINPLVWAYEKGLLRNPLKGRGQDKAETAEKANKVAAS